MVQAVRDLLFLILFFFHAVVSAKSVHKPRASLSLALAKNFPDPSLHYTDGAWWSFATRTPGSHIHVQVARKYDNAAWELLQVDALPLLPSWVYRDGDSAVWAPEVVQNVRRTRGTNICQ